MRAHSGRWPNRSFSASAALVPGLDILHAQLVLRKGYHKDVDSYSAFLEADRKTQTGLAGYLQARGIKRVFVCGLATDFCVAWSALDSSLAEQLATERRLQRDASRTEDFVEGVNAFREKRSPAFQGR